MEPSRDILSEPFRGTDCLELTHYRAEENNKAHPDPPYLDRESFTVGYRDSDTIRNMFLDPANRPDKEGNRKANPPQNTYKYSVPHVYRNRLTICSVHPNATLGHYSYIGSLKRNIYRKFLARLSKEYEKCDRMIIDKDSQVFEIARDNGKEFLIDSEGQPVPRKAISESMCNRHSLKLVFLSESDIRFLRREGLADIL